LLVLMNIHPGNQRRRIFGPPRQARTGNVRQRRVIVPGWIR
jgi:hypothetical protein